VKVALAILACACSPPPRVTANAHAVLPDVPFALLDHDQRVQFMKERVVPAMKPIFIAHDRRFSDFGCKTCHADDRTYAMPNGDLPELAITDLGRHEARDVEWMKTQVLPTMKSLLGSQGLTCLHCHPRAPE
jgi:hypothetical protein